MQAILWTTLLLASPVPVSDDARMAAAAAERARWRPGRGLAVRSADGRFSLQFGAVLQVQMAARHRGEVPAMGTEPGDPASLYEPAREAANDLSLSLRRARLQLGGDLFTPFLHYRVELTVAPIELGYGGGTIHRSPLLDGYFTLDRVRDATLQVGQYKVPYNHQRMVRASGLQFVDRSGASDEFTLDRDIGLDLRSRDVGGLGKLRYYAGVYIGDGITLAIPRDPGLAYVGRVELLPFGIYDDLEESDHDRGARPRLLIGGAFAYIARDPHDTHGSAGKVPADGRRASTANATADVSLRWAGFSLEAAVFWRKAVRQTRGVALTGEPNPSQRVEARNGSAYFAQVGYLLPRLPVELGARWGQIFAAGDRTATIRSLRDQSELGGVFSYYFARHALKLQLDYLRLWRTDIRLATDQVRLQLQVQF